MTETLTSVLDEFSSDGETSNLHLSLYKSRIIAAIERENMPWSDLAAHQIESYAHGERRAIIDTTTSDERFPVNLVVAEIKQSFNPRLRLEWFCFSDGESSAELHERFPSRSRPIKILDCSKRLKVIFHDRVPRIPTVVVFPEDWRYPIHKSVDELEQWNVLFFVDRFAMRTQAFSWPLLERCIDERTFPFLRQLIQNDRIELAERLCSDWLGPHERNHRTGSIPYVVTNEDDFRIYKRSRLAGGFEEGRADVNAMIELHGSGNDYQRAVAEFIFLERLFRYPVQHIVEKRLFKAEKWIDYDSISSQHLLYHLRRGGYLHLTNGRATISDDYLHGLNEYAELAEELQSRAREVAERTEGDEWKRKGAGRETIEQSIREAICSNGKIVLDSMYSDFAELLFGDIRTPKQAALNF